MTSPASDSAAANIRFLSGGGTMGAAIRAFDWGSTRLGPAETWPQALQAAVSIMLHAHYPINVYWGPDLINLYNDAYLPIVGKKHPDALGQPLHRVWPEVWESIEAALEGVLGRGENFFAENVQQFVTRSGFTEEIFMSFSYGPIFTAEGEVGGVFAAGTEVTGTVIGQRRLHLLRQLGANTAGSPDEVTACKAMTAVMAEHREDVPFSVFFLPDTNGDWEAIASSGFDVEADTLPRLPEDVPDGEVEAGDIPFTFPPGPWDEAPTRAGCWRLRLEPEGPALGLLLCGFSSRRPLDASYRDFHSLLVEQAARGLYGAQAIALADRRRAEIEELDRAKTEFLATVSHEFRTPLTLIRGPLGRLLSEDRLPTDAAEELRTVHANADRLLALVENLLAYAQMQAGRLDARFAEQDLGEVVRQTVGLFGSAFEHAGLDWAVETEELPEPVCIDRRLIEHVLVNLLSNALKFTPEGSITVRVLHGAEGPAVEVEDTGVGIPPDELPHIFERFHHTAPTAARDHEGAGIGLALVAELVAAHGAEIDVESEPGEGTCFRLRFRYGRDHVPADRIGAPAPARPDIPGIHLGPTASEAASGREREREAGHRRRILVVDDHPDMREYLRRELGEDFTVVAVGDAEAARKAIAQRLPECLVCDIMLPGVDGIELVRELRDDPATRDLPVILVSARADERTRLEGLKAGADDFVVKPFSAPELRERVRVQVESALEVARRERALRMAAEAAERAKSEFLANMSHEIRTPLSNIALASELLSRAGQDGTAARSVQRIRSNLDRLGELLDGVLTLARLQSGAELAARGATVIGEVVLETLDMFAHDADEKGVALNIDMTAAGSEARVALDRPATAIILRNLVSNAVKFTEEGSIEVRVDLRGDEVLLEVTDTGVGIDEAFLPALFHPFTQQIEGWSRPQEGSGIGLALTKRLVDAGGGRIDVESSTGEGSRFSLRLPRAGREATEVEVGPREQEQVDELRVLLAEDHPDTREMLSLLLEPVAEVTTVSNGEEALSVAAESAYDILLLDVNLGGRLTGKDVIARLRRTELHAHTPAIAITAFAMPGDEERLLAAGFDAYLAKPLNLDRLNALLEELPAASRRAPGLEEA